MNHVRGFALIALIGGAGADLSAQPRRDILAPPAVDSALFEALLAPVGAQGYELHVTALVVGGSMSYEGKRSGSDDAKVRAIRTRIVQRKGLAIASDSDRTSPDCYPGTPIPRFTVDTLQIIRQNRNLINVADADPDAERLKRDCPQGRPVSFMAVSRAVVGLPDLEKADLAKVQSGEVYWIETTARTIYGSGRVFSEHFHVLRRNPRTREFEVVLSRMRFIAE